MPASFPTHTEMFGTTANPCPPWCTMPPGHGYEGTGFAEDGTPDAWEFRTHSRTFRAAGTEGVELAQGEQLYPDGHLELHDLEIVPPEAHRHGLTGAQARAVAVALVQAADAVDEISSSTVLA